MSHPHTLQSNLNLTAEIFVSRGKPNVTENIYSVLNPKAKIFIPIFKLKSTVNIPCVARDDAYGYPNKLRFQPVHIGDGTFIETSILNDTQSLPELSTPTLSHITDIWNISMTDTIINLRTAKDGRCVFDITSLTVGTHSAFQSFCRALSICVIICLENISIHKICNDNCEGSLLAEEISLNNTFLSHKYISKGFFDNEDVKHQEVSQVLKQIRISNINRVVIGHLNVNFFATKLDDIKTIIPGNVDIMIFYETKIDDSYPIAQLLIDGFGKPFSQDRNSYVGGLLIYVRSDIPCKQINKHKFLII